MTRLAKAMSAFTNGRGAQSAGRLGIASACVLALLACLGIGASSAGAANLAKFGEIPHIQGATSGGDLFHPLALAANRDGEGGADAGDVYVIDDNNRVSQFSASGAFVRTFGQDVIGNEVQVVEIANASSGTYTLSFDPDGPGPEPAEVANLNFNSTSAQVQTALRALPSLNPANVNVSGGAGNNTLRTRTVEFVGDLAGTNVPELTANASGLSVGATVTVTTTRTGAGGDFTGYEICQAAQADSCKAGVASAQAGSLNNARGIAVDQDTGNVFVASTTNGRVDVFSATGEFQGAFGWKVDATTPLDELQFCTTATGCQAGESTSKGGGFAIPSPAGPRGLDVGDDGDVYVPDAVNFRYNVYSPTLNGSDEVTGVDFVRSVGYDVIATGPGQAGVSEVQTVTIRATDGFFRLNFAGATTGLIEFDADPSEVEAALNALTTIDGVEGSVSVTGGPGDASGSNPYVVTFGDALGGFDVPNTISVDTTDLGIPIGTQLSCASSTTATTTNFRWLRNGIPIDGATAATYTTSATSTTTPVSTTGDAGAAIQCQVTKLNANAGSTQVSNPRMVVSDVPAIPPPLAPTQNIASPGGTATQASQGSGGKLTCNPNEANWTGVTEPFAYQWYRNGVALDGNGADTNEYSLQAADVATPAVFQCAVTGSNDSGSVTKVSQNKATANAPGAPSPAAPPTNAGSPNVTATSSLAPSTGEETTKGVAALETCDASVNTCKVGVAGGGDGQFGASNPTAVAVGPDGDVFALSSGTCSEANPCRIQRFDSDGTLEAPSFGPSEGECSTLRTSGFTTTSSGSQALDVDPDSGNVFVLQRILGATGKVCELEGESGEEVGISPPSPLAIGQAVDAGLTIGAQEGVFAVNANASPVHILGPPPPPEVELLATTEITQTSAKLNGKVTAPMPGDFDTAYRFEVSDDGGASWRSVPDSPVSVGSTPGTFTVHQTATGLQPNLNHRVRLVATTGPSATSPEAIFKTLPAPPTVTYTGVAPAVTTTGAQIKGVVNPNNSPTTYRFQWGTTSAYGNNAPDFEPFIGNGGEPLTVSVNLSGLEPDTTYHYRLHATNGAGKTNGIDRTFTTVPAESSDECPNEAIREQQGIADTVPDCRAYELVSPADKGASGSVASLGVLVELEQISIQAARGGGGAAYPIQNGVPDSTSGGWTRWHAGRTDEGWLQQQISAPALIKPTKSGGGDSFAMPSLVRFASPDLSCAVVQSYNPLTEDTPQAGLDAGMENLYRWSAEDGEYELITDVVPSNPNATASLQVPPYAQIDASSDCSHVYFKSFYNFFPSSSNLYGWDGESLHDAGLLPDGSVGANNLQVTTAYAGSRAVLGAETARFATARWNAVSPDGDRLFFTAIVNQGPSSGKPAVFMREVGEDGQVEVVEVSASQTAVATNGARFEAASPDGSTVLFRANYGIAATSSPGPTNQVCGPRPGGGGIPQETTQEAFVPLEARNCDLYIYDVETGELTDISVGTNPADPAGAQIQGAVAIDEDGSHVYFAALGQLIPGEGRTYAQNTAGGGSANVYLWNEGELSYVVTLDRGTGENADLFGGGPGVTESIHGAVMRVPQNWRAEVSTDGNRLLFSSSSNVAGYEGGGGKAAYLYSAETGELTCVTCPPDGSPTLMPANARIAGENEKAGLLGRPRAGGQTYRPHAMSEDGSRVFFASLDALAPGAISGERNIYQWHQGKVSFLAIVEPSGAGGFGELLDISADGKDVLIATNQQLVPEDKDTVSDLYNVRVDGGFLYEEPAPACQVDEAVPLIPDQIYCQGAASAQPGAVGLASPGFFGPGNPAPAGQPARRCNRQQVRRGKRCVAKRALARRACAKRKGKAKRRCVANQMRRLNRVQQRQWRQQQRRANANRGGAR